jgi:hypothetical protein
MHSKTTNTIKKITIRHLSVNTRLPLLLETLGEGSLAAAAGLSASAGEGSLEAAAAPRKYEASIVICE